MAIYDTIMDIFPSEQISHRHRKIQVAANLTILTFDVLPIALFEADVLYFSKHVLKFGFQTPPKSVDPNWCPSKRLLYFIRFPPSNYLLKLDTSVNIRTFMMRLV